MILRHSDMDRLSTTLPGQRHHIAKAAELKINKGTSFTSNSLRPVATWPGFCNALTTPKRFQVEPAIRFAML